MNQLNKKTPSFYCLLLLLFPFSLYSQKKIIYPKEFPKNLIGTKLCAEINTSGKMFGGSTAFLKLPVEIFISKDLGIYARYNPNEQFNEDKWGETQKIEVFNLWKTIPRMDEYGDLIGIEYHYKVPQCDWLNGTGHCITAFSIYDFYGSKYAPAGKNLSIHLSVPSYENAHFYTGYTNINNCGQLKSEHELQKEKEELLKIENQKREQEKIEKEKLLKIENQKREQDKLTALKIDSLLSLNLLEDAALFYEKFYFPDFELENKIQFSLEKKHERDTILLDEYTAFNYIIDHSKSKNAQILRLEEGEYKIIFNTTGKAITTDLPNIGNIGSRVNIPSIKVGHFEIKQNSKMILKVTHRDSLLVSTIYKSGCSKTLFMDESENFYLKTKTGLPNMTLYVAYSVNVDKNIVEINKAFINQKYINGLVVETKNYNTVKFTKILEKE